jgi:16S rRNA C1402 (ribose-2'-O) methylase RsmI
MYSSSLVHLSREPFSTLLFLSPFTLFLVEDTRKSNSNSLASQFGIHLILAKQEKMTSNSLANQLGKNRNLAIMVANGVSL